MKKPKDTPPDFDSIADGIWAVFLLCLVWGLFVAPLVVPDIVRALELP